jgi:translation initiation factor 3 subunit I
LSVGEGLLAFTADAFMGTQSMIHVMKLEQDIEQQSSKSILSIEAPRGRITRVFWSELNRCLVTSHDGGFLRKWDSEVQDAKEKILAEVVVNAVLHSMPL